MADQLNLALLILRLATGLMILAHGYNHVFRGGKIQGTGRWFASMGMKPPRWQKQLRSWRRPMTCRSARSNCRRC